jgi:tetraacyldisaccharide 4'-kinase
VLYAGGGPAPLQPAALVQRTLGLAWPLADWWVGNAAAARPLAGLRGRPLLAMAGLASPEKFFAMLEAEGLSIERLPQPDHARYDALPWPPGTRDVVTTEKDAVKLHPASVGEVRVWVVGLDLRLPPAWVSDLTRLLRAAGPAGPSAPTPSP